MLGILLALHTPHSGVPVALGIFVVEEGSLFYNAWFVDATLRSLPKHFPWWPSSSGAINMAYRVLMSASNVDAGQRLQSSRRVLASSKPKTCDFPTRIVETPWILSFFLIFREAQWPF